jgi:hypothetical protein
MTRPNLSRLVDGLKPINQHRRFPELNWPVVDDLFGPLLGLFQALAIKIDAGSRFAFRSQYNDEVRFQWHDERSSGSAIDNALLRLKAHISNGIGSRVRGCGPYRGAEPNRTPNSP